jgi:hypothetical protein
MTKLCKRPILAIVLVLGLGFSQSSLAQQAEDLGQHLVHYNTMNTSQLSPEVASAYGIQRSGTRGLLNIAVLKKEDDGLNTPVTARVSATATNLAGQRRDLEMQEIRDQDAIYYVATFRFHNEEHLNFRVSVQPEGQGRTREFSFRQQFYAD